MKIADMAKECHVSESYLRRQFKKYSGMSPVAYVRLRKIMAAKNFLQYSDMSMD
ncbi:MAG: AraC family transcriptional regulator, partial [Clostridia bacterium]|nr:AraC family transcriptional regulator [Clostridia bacterium]